MTTRKVATAAGKTIATMKEWEANEAYRNTHISIKACFDCECTSSNPAVTCCVNILTNTIEARFSPMLTIKCMVYVCICVNLSGIFYHVWNDNQKFIQYVFESHFNEKLQY